MSTQEERRRRSTVSERGKTAFKVLQNVERTEMKFVPLFAQALEVTPLEFVVFACLGTRKGREELRLDLFETIFLKRFRRKAAQLFREFEKEGVQTTLRIILPNLEPRRTWGWQTPQEEITGYCHMMADDAASRLPKEWTVLVWSDIETCEKAETGYREAITWTETHAHPLVVRDEQRFFRELDVRHPDILTRHSPQVLALRQIAAYAHEGKVLEQAFPSVILLQTDTPVGRKDTMLQPLRKQLLPIAHPFTD